MYHLIIKAGGSGIRFGTAVPKQYQEVFGHPIFYYIIQQYLSLNLLASVTIVSRGDWIDYCAHAVKDLASRIPVFVIAGGPSSGSSTKNGVVFLRNKAKPDDFVFIHDATNPTVCVEGIKKMISCCEKYPFLSLGSRQVHAIYKIKDDTIADVLDKKEVCSGYSPELFKFAYLLNFYLKASPDVLDSSVSPVALASSLGNKVHIVIEDFYPLKITYRDDLEVFKNLIVNYYKYTK